MKTTYTITNRVTGHRFGAYTAESLAGALDAMARDAGYADYDTARETAPIDDVDFVARVVEMSPAALAVVEEAGVYVAGDIDSLINDELTAESLLAHCLDGAEEDRVQGWRDYVAAVVAASH